MLVVGEGQRHRALHRQARARGILDRAQHIGHQAITPLHPGADMRQDLVAEIPGHQAVHALEREVRGEHTHGQPAQVQLGRHARQIARGRTDAVHLHGHAAGADRQGGAQRVAQAVPAVFSLRARLPGQALRRGEQIGTGHHALGRHLQAGHGIEHTRAAPAGDTCCAAPRRSRRCAHSRRREWRSARRRRARRARPRSAGDDVRPRGYRCRGRSGPAGRKAGRTSREYRRTPAPSRRPSTAASPGLPVPRTTGCS